MFGVMYHYTTLKSLEHCGYVCFIALGVGAEIASAALNLKEHKTQGGKSEHGDVFRKSRSFVCIAANVFRCLDVLMKDAPAFTILFLFRLTNDPDP